MEPDPTSDERGELRTLQPLPQRNAAWWQGVLLVLAGWASLGLVHVASEAQAGPSSVRSILLTLSLAGLALAAVAIGATIAVTAAMSPLRHVFHSRPAFWAAGSLFALGAVVLLTVAAREPFDGVASHGKPLIELIADLTCLAAAVVLVVGGGVAFSRGLDAHRNERSWGTTTPRS